MINEEQQKWLDHLSDTKQVFVVVWDPTCEEKFLQVKNQIQNILGKQQAVEHRGASSLKISGQDEIDVYVPVLKEEFEQTVDLITRVYGSPKSIYPLKRARFITEVDGKHIDIFVINKDDKDWLNAELFHNYLLANSQKLDEYRKLKENNSGKSVKEYYTKKTEFINEILANIKLVN